MERCVARGEVLALQDEDVPFDDVLWPGASRLERRSEVAQRLFRLRQEVADADDASVGGDGVLTADKIVLGASRLVNDHASLPSRRSTNTRRSRAIPTGSFRSV
jgi:hypothetical protein